MQPDVYAIHFEMQIEDKASEIMSKIADQATAAIDKMKELTKACVEFTKGSMTELEKSTQALVKSHIDMRTAANERATAEMRAGAIGKKAGEEKLTKLEEEKKAQEALNRLQDEREAKQDKMFNAFGVIGKIAITIRDLGKSFGSLFTHASKSKSIPPILKDASSAAVGAAKSVDDISKSFKSVGGAAAGATAGVGGLGGGIGGIFNAITGFLGGPAATAFAGFLMVIGSAFEHLVDTMEKFTQSMYLVRGGMYRLTNMAVSMAAGIRATTGEVVNIISELSKAGVAEEHIQQLTETTTIFTNATGASADASARFVKIFHTVTGDIRQAEAAMMMLYNASKKFGLSASDLDMVMRDVTESAIYLGKIGSETFKIYTENLVAGVAAAKALGINTEKIFELLNRAKKITSYAALLGPRAIWMTPDQKQMAIMQEATKLQEKMSKMSFPQSQKMRLQLGARLSIPPEEVDQALAGLAETLNQKKRMIELGVTIKGSEEALEKLKSDAMEATTSTLKEAKVALESIKNTLAMLIMPILPPLRLLFRLFTGILSIVQAFVGPIVDMLTSIIKMFDVSSELEDTFAALKSIARAIGQVVAVIVAAFVFLMNPVIFTLIGAFKMIWFVLRPIIIGIQEGIVVPIQKAGEGVKWLGDQFSKAYKKIAEFFGFAGKMETFNNGMKWLGRIIGGLLLPFLALYAIMKTIMVLNWIRDHISDVKKYATAIYDTIKAFIKSIFWKDMNQKATIANTAVTTAATGVESGNTFARNLNSASTISNTAATGTNTGVLSINTFRKLANTLATKAGSIWTGISTAAQWLWNTAMSVGTGIATAFGTAMVFVWTTLLPIIAIIVAVVAVGYLLYKCWGNIVGVAKMLWGWISKVIDVIIDAAKWVWNFIGGFEGLFKVIMRILNPFMLIIDVLKWLFGGKKEVDIEKNETKTGNKAVSGATEINTMKNEATITKAGSKAVSGVTEIDTMEIKAQNIYINGSAFEGPESIGEKKENAKVDMIPSFFEGMLGGIIPLGSITTNIQLRRIIRQLEIITGSLDSPTNTKEITKLLNDFLPAIAENTEASKDTGLADVAGQII